MQVICKWGGQNTRNTPHCNAVQYNTTENYSLGKKHVVQLLALWQSKYTLPVEDTGCLSGGGEIN